MFPVETFLMIESMSMEASSAANSVTVTSGLWLIMPDLEANLALCLQPFGSKSGMISHSPEVTVTEFAAEEASIDIDSIIKKVSTGNMSERIVSKRA
jgi:hypothetical protein